MARDSAHGTRQRYQSGCVCDDCRAANRRYQQLYRSHRTGRWWTEPQLPGMPD